LSELALGDFVIRDQIHVDNLDRRNFDRLLLLPPIRIEEIIVERSLGGDVFVLEVTTALRMIQSVER
jgi:hypothetical protein